jgi:hypothetical protein
MPERKKVGRCRLSTSPLISAVLYCVLRTVWWLPPPLSAFKAAVGTKHRGVNFPLSDLEFNIHSNHSRLNSKTGALKIPGTMLY